MIAPFEVATFTRAKLPQSANKLSQQEIDQGLADEQFIAWVLGTGYAAGHVPTVATHRSTTSSRASHSSVSSGPSGHLPVGERSEE